MAVYEFGPFRLDTIEHCLLRHGRLVALPDKAFDILVLLVENSGHLLTKEELMQMIWPDVAVEDNNLTVSISKIRKVLRDRNRKYPYIVTFSRRGYRFMANVRRVS